MIKLCSLKSHHIAQYYSRAPVFQLANHNKDLASLLKPLSDIPGDQALEYYARHTAQIEVSCHLLYLCGTLKHGHSVPLEHIPTFVFR